MAFTLLLLAASMQLSVTAKVDGEGYLRFARDGRAVYAKEAKLTVKEGKLADSYGDLVLPTVRVPSDAQGLSIDLEGNVVAVQADAKPKVGRLVLAVFPEGTALTPSNGVLMAADRPKLLSPGEDIAGVIRTNGGAPTATAKPPVITKPSATPTSAPVKQPVNQKATAKIVIAPSSSISGESILLGQIANITADPATAAKLAEVDLGSAPALGIKKVIDRLRVNTKLRAAGFTPEKFSIVIPEGAEVHSEGQAIPASKFLMAAIGALQAKAGAASSWDTKDPLPDFIAPLGTLELKVEQVGGAEEAHATVVVAVYIDDRRINSRTIHFDRSSPMAMKVTAGSAVKVVLIAGTAKVEVPGRTKSSSAVGKTVEVEVRCGTPEVKTTHIGTLVAAGIVEVRV